MLGELPDEVALGILSRLSFADLLRASLVSKRVHALCSDAWLWGTLLYRRRPRGNTLREAEAAQSVDGTIPTTPIRDGCHNSEDGPELRLEERLAFYAVLANQLDPQTSQLFLGTSLLPPPLFLPFGEGCL